MNECGTLYMRRNFKSRMRNISKKFINSAKILDLESVEK